MRPARARLSSPARWLLAISCTFALSVALSNTFVNVYLWKVDHRYGAIGWYNLAIYSLMPAAFVAAGAAAKRYGGVFTLRAGVIMHVLFYLLTLAGGERIARLPLLLGAVMGTAAGFYWFSFNWLSVRLTKTGARERFYGLNGVMGALAGIVAPPVAGYLITIEDRLGGLTGYHVIFALSLGLFVVATVFSGFLRARFDPGRLRLRTAWNRAMRTPFWRLILFGCLVYGLREGVFLFLIGLLMYVATGSEMRLGEFLLLQGALSAVSFFLVSRWVNENNRLGVCLVGSLCMAAAALLFLRPVTAGLIVVYGAAIAVCLPMFLVPLQGTIFDGVSRVAGEDGTQAEHVILREVFENIGRVAGIAAFIALSATNPSARGIGVFACVLGFVQIGTWVLLRKSARQGAPREDRGGVGRAERAGGLGGWRIRSRG
ncbi:MFS transporter [Alicyclobacillus sp.]|uniref:MFS transporter n=1 Tax=Alicyclobacillus sp. TaxID=61169 RepID=UPI0025BE4453|nr:MFS transporter [Alicyclobacillus sp.]MCL6515468.1 MFS transporter [Alicyclobacillus sp.]